MKQKEWLMILQKILHEIEIGIHIIDKNGITIAYNPAMEAIEGMHTEQVIGKHFRDSFEHIPLAESTLMKALHQQVQTINQKQTYFNQKYEPITTINTTFPVLLQENIIGVVEIAKDVTKIQQISEQILQLQDQKKTKNSKKKRTNHYQFSDILGSSNQLAQRIQIAKKAAQSNASLLIIGETGTGKELFAQSIHDASVRSKQPFVAQNCAAFPGSLFEGILFGTSKGAFTGAIDRPGLLEQANGGSLLLDEINSLPLDLQAKLLRVLQEGYYQRIGGTKNIAVDVRFMATSNQDLLQLVAEGSFRKDLYYRINVLHIDIPPLRMRKEDINVLIDHMIDRYCEDNQQPPFYLTKPAKRLLNEYDWPGNVRELENVLLQAMTMADSNVLETRHFLSIQNKNKDYSYESTDKKGLESDQSLPAYLQEREKMIILYYLQENVYNITATAHKLGIKRQTLQHKLKKYGISIA